MRILNTEELRFVYGGHPGHKHGKKNGNHKPPKNACPTTTTRRSTKSTRDSTSTRRNKRRKY